MDLEIIHNHKNMLALLCTLLTSCLHASIPTTYLPTYISPLIFISGLIFLLSLFIVYFSEWSVRKLLPVVPVIAPYFISPSQLSLSPPHHTLLGGHSLRWMPSSCSSPSVILHCAQMLPHTHCLDADTLPQPSPCLPLPSLGLPLADLCAGSVWCQCDTSSSPWRRGSPT